MRLVRRLVLVFAVVAVPGLDASAAVAAPEPSPALDSVLIAPVDPTFVDDPTGLAFPEGYATVSEWAAAATFDPATVVAVLRRDGFNTGYERAWTDISTHREIIVGICAFAGANGAEAFLTYVRSNPPMASAYVHAISVSGLALAIGAHYADPASFGYLDMVGFIKGNDYFFVTVRSPADNMDDIASRQTSRQYDAAPAYTIPPQQWPEHAPNHPRIVNGWIVLMMYYAAPTLIVGAAIAVLVWSRRNLTLTTQPPRRSLEAILMSNDGQQWWDGRTWRNTSVELPPDAVLSTDGSQWWDGTNWRPVPQPPAG